MSPMSAMKKLEGAKYYTALERMSPAIAPLQLMILLTPLSLVQLASNDQEHGLSLNACQLELMLVLRIDSIDE